MKKSKLIFERLRCADNDILNKIADKCSPLDKAADKRIYSSVQKKYAEKVTNKEYIDYEYKVEGVDAYMRPKWSKLIRVAILCFAVVGLIGGVSFIRKMGSSNSRKDYGYFAESGYDPFEQPAIQKAEEQETMLGFGLIEPAKDRELKYSPKMSLDFWIDNSGSSNDFGFMVYVDGVRQDISIDGGSSEDMHVFYVDSGERKTFTVSFEPTAAHYDDTLGICFGVMVDPKFVPETPTTVFGNRYSINALDLILTDVPESIGITDSIPEIKSAAVPDEIKQKYNQYDENGNVSGNRLEKSVQFLNKKVNNEIDDKTPNAVSVSDKLEIQLLGGTETTWRVSMYADHRLMPVFNGRYYADMQAGTNKMSTFTVDMSELELSAEDYGAIYCIAVPTDGGRLVKSHTMVFNGREETE